MDRNKILLTTIADNINFGTYLQIVATGVILDDLGFKVRLLHYVRKHLCAANIIKDHLKREENILKRIYHLTFIPKWLLTRRKHWAFVRNHLDMTKRYDSYIALSNESPKADIYMTGSDQVWNSIHNKGLDPTFYCKFAPDNSKKVAFSASIGMTDFQEFEKKEVTDMLSEYSAISVRELSAKETIENLGIKDLKVTLDPTLTISKDRWNKIIPHDKLKATERFLLIYSVETTKQNDILIQISKKIANERNLKIYSVSVGKNYHNGCDRYFSYASPELFISLIRQSSYMVVSSFHGTAFAINFNKQFLTVAPDKFSSRIDSILKICGITDRKITGPNTPIPSGEIDFGPVNAILDNERKKTIDTLNDMLY